MDPCNEAGINATIVVKLYYSTVASTFNPYLRLNSGILNTCTTLIYNTYNRVWKLATLMHLRPYKIQTLGNTVWVDYYS